MIARGLAGIAAHGRFLIVAGLVAGLAVPPLAGTVRPWVASLVVVLLALSAFRIGWRSAVGAMADARRTLAFVVLAQVALPLAVLGLQHGLGWSGAAAMALLLMTTSCPIAGTPNLTLMTGGDPAPALRLLIVATVALPLTSLPIFALIPALQVGTGFLAATIRLAAIIAGASATGFAARALIGHRYTPEMQGSIDGLSALTMAVVVMGLMQALSDLSHSDLPSAAMTLAYAFALNFGFQILSAVLARRAGLSSEIAAYGISAGNRNFVLFLAALPAAVMDPVMAFIGCYQIPMYLTPLLLGAFYRALSGSAGRAG